MTDNTKSFISTVTTELGRVASGTSKFVNGSIAFDMQKLPFAQLLNRFANDDNNPELAKQLISGAEQDFGTRFATFVQGAYDDLRRARGENVPLPVPPPAVNMFVQEMFNQFSTILQYSTGRQLDARQIERLQSDIQRLSAAIDKEIKEQAKLQALEICKVLNQVTQDGFVKVGKDLDDVATRLKALEDELR